MGVPIHETALVRAVASRMRTLSPPGPGRSLFIIFEPDIGLGRPDLVVLSISAQALRAYIERGLRLPSLAAAKVLVGGPDARHLGVSSAYARSLFKQLQKSGWTRRAVSASQNAVHASLSIEVKVRDWRRALRQVTKFRFATDSSAIALPDSQTPLVNASSLDRYGIGLIAVGNNKAEWREHPAPRTPNAEQSLWLLETLLRGLDEGRAYRLSRDLNSATAAAIEATRGA